MMDQKEIDPELLFDLCDPDRKGYLVASDLRTVCPQLDDDEINFIFKILDLDGSGNIDRQEFLGGFQNALCQGESHGYPGIKRRASVIEVNRRMSATTDTPLASDIVFECLAESDEQPGLGSKPISKSREEVFHSDSEATFVADINLPCQDEILQLYEQLQSAGIPKVLGRFEKIVGNFCKEFKEQRDQNVRLQRVFESERESYNRRMNEVESEIDQQIAQTEQRAREEERKKLSREKEKMRTRLEGEMNELKANIARMKMMVTSAEALRNQPTTEVKHKMRDLSQENQALKSKLAESHLELAIIKSELATVRADYESKKEEMLSDSEAFAEKVRQTENLQRQLKLLFDANKRLHDTNDSLREALDQKSVQTPSSFSFDSSSAAEQKGVASPYNTDEDADSGLALKYEGSLSSDLESTRSTTATAPETEFGESNGAPERTFRVVMCGDAAVGKSSIVARIIKDTFSGNLPSTLGVDFHVKAACVDGKNVAIQLWDTAGQERFRSLCKSYFRRADGAILVYDCTAEETFINVREWIETIKESTMRQIPVMLCGNKIDLRGSQVSRTVSTKDGEALAAAIGALFAECSALDGTNVEGALMNLTRELMATEDVEIKGTGVVIMPKDSKRMNSCCSRS